MRRQGADWDSIVAALGYASSGHAHDRWMAVTREYPRDDVESLRDLELDRIEQKTRELEKSCQAGDSRAIEVWNKLSERRSKLMGLDKPERREITVLTDDVVQKSIREANDALTRKTSEARELGIAIPLELTESGVYETVENR